MRQSSAPSPYWEDIPYSVNIYHQNTPNGLNGTLHLHDVFELLLVLSDHVTVLINEDQYAVSKNTLLLFNRTDLHCVRVSDTHPYDRHVLYMCAEQIDACSTSKTYLLDCFCRRTSSASCILPLSDEQAAAIVDLYTQLEQNLNGKEDVFGSDIYFRSLLCQLLVLVNRYYLAHYHLPRFEANMMPQTIYSLVQFIYENYTRELTLSDLAERSNISKPYLCRLFKNVMGTSPMEYVHNLKMAKAKELLIKGCSVMDTCEKVGYNDLSNFSRQFKAQIGISPQQYAILNRSHPI